MYRSGQHLLLILALGRVRAEKFFNIDESEYTPKAPSRVARSRPPRTLTFEGKSVDYSNARPISMASGIFFFFFTKRSHPPIGSQEAPRLVLLWSLNSNIKRVFTQRYGTSHSAHEQGRRALPLLPATKSKTRAGGLDRPTEVMYFISSSPPPPPPLASSSC